MTIEGADSAVSFNASAGEVTETTVSRGQGADRTAFSTRGMASADTAVAMVDTIDAFRSLGMDTLDAGTLNTVEGLLSDVGLTGTFEFGTDGGIVSLNTVDGDVATQ